MNRGRRGAIAALLLGCASSPSARSWPARTRLLLPSSPGGALDQIARALAEALGRALDSDVLVEHRPGASGLLAARAVAAAPGDGSTLLYLHSGHVTLQALGARFDVLKDLRPVASLHASPHVLAATRKWRDAGALLDALRTRADGLRFGSGGIGSPSHLIVERLLLALEARGRPLHVPYKSPTEAMRGVASGDLDFGFAFAGTVAALADSQRLSALAVGAATRLVRFPQWPTLLESGLPGFVDEVWGGLALPGNADDERIGRLSGATRAALETPAFIESVERSGGTVWSDASTAAFMGRVLRDLESDRALGSRLGLRLEA
jgi:tripartite-type tricarboxylate transporter receptor subunit TctC